MCDQCGNRSYLVRQVISQHINTSIQVRSHQRRRSWRAGGGGPMKIFGGGGGKHIVLPPPPPPPNKNIGFPGQVRNFVDQIHFMSIQFRRFGSCITDSSFNFIFPAFEFALTTFKSTFVSFKFPKNATSSQNGHSI